jgi:type IV pilus assembly protein PilQ
MRNLSYVRKVKVLVLVLLLVIALSPGLLLAAAAAEDTNTEDANKAEVLTAIQMKMQQPVSVDFRETPIDDVLRMLAKQADVDIVKSPAVIGNVTATLTDVPLAEALDNILAAHGYGYLATEHMIRVMPQKDIYEAPEKLVERVYKITYADVTELEKALAKFISKQGNISSMPGTSNIIVKDTESNIRAMDKFVEEVDRVTQQVLVEVRVYDVTDTDSFDLGINWNAGRNTVNATGGLMTETTGDGITYNATQPATGIPATAPPLQTSTKRADPFGAGSFDKTSGGSLRLGFFNDAFSLDVILTALQKQEWSTLLANPSILVLDNETANFEIIREIPYTENQQSSTGSSTMTSTQFKNVGVKLKVIPHITRDDMLRLHIMPEFSVAEEQLITTATESTVPVVNTRKLDTIALLKNGETVVLGGLRKQEVTKKLYKIPLLGDIPLVKGLFRTEAEKPVTTELLVFITPKIVDVPVLQSHEAETYKYTDIPKVKYPPLEHHE